MIWKYEYEIVETCGWHPNGGYSFLKSDVKDLIQEGWIPAGGMLQEHREFDHRDYVSHEYKYSQAMVGKQFIFKGFVKRLFVRITQIIKPIPQV